MGVHILGLLACVLVLAFATGGSGDAAECTDSEVLYAVELYEAAANASACAPYATVTSSQVYISGPCSVTSCLEIMQFVASKLPDCEYSGVNEKQELETSLTACSSGSAAASATSAPSSASSGGSSSTNTVGSTSASSWSSTVCTTDERQSVIDLYAAAANTSDCAPYASATNGQMTIYSPCSASLCISVMTELSKTLPDCECGGINEKQQLTTGLAVCSGGSSTTGSAALTGTTTAPTPTPTPTPMSTDASSLCTETEIAYMAELYSTAASSSACMNASRIYSYIIDVYTTCTSTCASTLKDLAASLPDCYYGFENINKKSETQSALAKCVDSVKTQYVYVSFYPDDSASSTAPISADITADGSGSFLADSAATTKTLGTISAYYRWLVLLSAVVVDIALQA
ncbi:hypothetical protein BBJ28_00007178 [Nothophytophthora sp. Chile5]|nr:hypothetical protein BBJ28_00007178 [Nothophytophthora sp. Chile5]